jgi:integrase
MIALLALQGLRQIEVVRLDVGDVDLVASTAMVRGKGEDDKELVYLHPETTKALTDYLKTNKVADGALFFSQSNNSRNRRLTTKGVRIMVQDILTHLGIEKTVHGFRHFFTTTLIKSYKGDLLEVARYTRHKTLEMLTVYNDNIKQKADLPRFYSALANVSL